MSAAGMVKKELSVGKKFPIHFVLLSEVRESAAASLQHVVVPASPRGRILSHHAVGSLTGCAHNAQTLSSEGDRAGLRELLCFPPMSSYLAESSLGRETQTYLGS